MTTKKKTFHRLSLLLTLALLNQGFLGRPQDIAGGASSLVGQDIIGGAAIAFKRPPRVRDLSGGASVLIVRRRPRPTEIARNNPPKPQGVARPGPNPGDRR